MEAIERKQRLAEAAVLVLIARQEIPSLVGLADGKKIVVTTVGNGRDRGDLFDHLIAKAGPPANDAEFHFFYSVEIVKVSDFATGHVLLDLTRLKSEAPLT